MVIAECWATLGTLADLSDHIIDFTIHRALFALYRTIELSFEFLHTESYLLHSSSICSHIWSEFALKAHVKKWLPKIIT